MINDKKDLINEKIENINNKVKARDVIYLLIGTGYASFGLVTTFLGLPHLGIPALITSTALGMGIHESRKRKKDSIERCVREKKHLDRVGKEGIDTSKESCNRRLNKLKELKTNKKQREKERKANNLLSESLTLLCGIAPLAASANPLMALLISSIAGAGKIAIEKYQTAETKYINSLRNRINNLYNDLDIIRDTYRVTTEEIKEEKQLENEKSAKKKEEKVINIETEIIKKSEEEKSKAMQKVKKL